MISKSVVMLTHNKEKEEEKKISWKQRGDKENGQCTELSAELVLRLTPSLRRVRHNQGFFSLMAS